MSWNRPLRAAVRADTTSAVPDTLLQVIRDEGQISRADLSRVTGLAPATVTAHMQGFADRRLIVESGRGPSTGGKPPTLLQLSEDQQLVVALDLSRSPVVGGLVDLRGRLLVTRAALSKGRAAARIDRLITDLVAEADTSILGIGIATPGVIDDKGTVRRATASGLQTQELAGDLTTRFGLPARVGNDADAVAVAEFTHRMGNEGLGSMAVLSVGEAVGAGIILNGRLHVGDRLTAGEIGHIPVVADGGAACQCGRFGCLVAEAAVPAILQVSDEMSSADRELRLRSLVDSPRVIQAGSHLGRVAGLIAEILSISRIVLAGEIRHAGDSYLEAVRNDAQAALLPDLDERLDVSYSQIGADAGILGAAAFVRVAELGFL